MGAGTGAHGGASRARRHRRRLRDAAHGAVEPGRAAPGPPPDHGRRLLARLPRQPPHPAGGRQRHAPADVAAAGGGLPGPALPGLRRHHHRQTTAHADYQALAAGLRYDAGRAGTVSVAYTLSRAPTTATNDRDAIDIPQDRTDLEAEYALARTEPNARLHGQLGVRAAFLQSTTNRLVKAAAQGWQVSGIATFWSACSISRVVNGNTNGGRRGIRVDQVGDPLAGLPASGPGYVYWFNPAAFAPPADGSRRHRPRPLPPPRRQPVGRHAREGLPAAAAPAPPGPGGFPQRAQPHSAQPGRVQNVCGALDQGTCASGARPPGRITATRSPREIQLGLRLSWN